MPALAVTLIASGCAANQAGPPPSGSPVVPGRECRTIDQLLARANPEPMAARPLKRVYACREIAGATIARELGRLRASRDTVALERASRLVHYLHDAQVYSAALDIAGDRASSVEARVNAIRVLAMTLKPSQEPSLALFFREPEERYVETWCSCTGHYYHGYSTTDTLTWPALGRLVPRDFAGRIQALLARIEGDAEEPQPVRWAARRVRRMTPERELMDLLATRWPPPAAPGGALR